MMVTLYVLLRNFPGEVAVLHADDDNLEPQEGYAPPPPPKTCGEPWIGVDRNSMVRLELSVTRILR